MVDLLLDPVFLFIGVAACTIAAISPRPQTRIFVWLGVWSILYGLSQLSQAHIFVTISPAWFQHIAPFATSVATFLAVFPALLSFRELSGGKLRSILNLLLLWESAVGIAAGALFLLTGSNAWLMFYNQIFWVGMMVVLTTIVAVPRFSNRYLVLPDRGVLAAGMQVFIIDALVDNVLHAFGLKTNPAVDSLAFGVLLFSFSYIGLRRVFDNERRLFAVEKELSVAREIQKSILPGKVPEIKGLRVSAVYCPMTAVAGDFYEIIAVDEHRTGFLVADVSGHGVPAALVASMIKVAAKMVVGSASQPGTMVCSLNRALSGLLGGQLISAAYLCVDTEKGIAGYSAAGHPPLLLWREQKLLKIESNGLLFGIMPSYDAYPVYTTPVMPGDRFLLYTDGILEAENSSGEPFGDNHLEHVLRCNSSLNSAELANKLIDELRTWQSWTRSLQDDVTLLVIDAT